MIKSGEGKKEAIFCMQAQVPPPDDTMYMDYQIVHGLFSPLFASVVHVTPAFSCIPHVCVCGKFLYVFSMGVCLCVSCALRKKDIERREERDGVNKDDKSKPTRPNSGVVELLILFFLAQGWTEIEMPCKEVGNRAVARK